MLYTSPKVGLFVIRKLFSISHAAFFPYKPFTKYEVRNQMTTRSRYATNYESHRPMDENNKNPLLTAKTHREDSKLPPPELELPQHIYLGRK
jgi:hypothetical protein